MHTVVELVMQYHWLAMALLVHQKVRQNDLWYSVDLAGFNGRMTPSTWHHYGDQGLQFLDLCSP